MQRASLTQHTIVAKLLSRRFGLREASKVTRESRSAR